MILTITLLGNTDTILFSLGHALLVHYVHYKTSTSCATNSQK